MNKQPNRQIHCSVETCHHQCKDSKCCTLNAISVGNTQKNAEHAAATQCASFEFAGELHPNAAEVARLKQQKSVGDSMKGSLYQSDSMDANRGKNNSNR